METSLSPEKQQTVDQIYMYAADLLVNQKLGSVEVKNRLTERGLSAEIANIVVNNMQQQIAEVKKSKAKKDMIYGAVWMVGGLVLTIANIGFIFWGAVLFGAIQFIQGAVKATRN
ncbi:hypothetical protein [Fulvivirga sediminis]|uniref:Uncharacterized protein n=1 Tax=Fulvivirga sediminis TaxID=2803949 RepID=A0A937F6N5_9BACT|nr:hypothetical protein [Fulvivirga sediminis]MBL3656002.1 hypothetical protein [Fulvivirga sediminis]